MPFAERHGENRTAIHGNFLRGWGHSGVSDVTRIISRTTADLNGLPALTSNVGQPYVLPSSPQSHGGRRSQDVWG